MEERVRTIQGHNIDDVLLLVSLYEEKRLIIKDVAQAFKEGFDYCADMRLKFDTEITKTKNGLAGRLISRLEKRE